jgi:CspA family cold shock protein
MWYAQGAIEGGFCFDGGAALRREGDFFVAVEPQKKKGGLQHMAQGTVSRFNEQKGYGFISPDHGGGDVFVHYSDIEGAGFRSLEEGEKVTYEVTQGRKGMQAQNVSKA